MMLKLCGDSGPDTFSGRKILVTGGLGFIGGWLSRALIDAGAHVDVFDRMMDCTRTTLGELGVIGHPSLRILRGDILSREDMARLDDDYDYIVHAAGILGIRRVSIDSLLTLDVNINGTLRALELAMRQKKLQRFIQFSTSEVYGQSAMNTHEESDAVIPLAGTRWCYATSKLASEEFARAAYRESGVPVVIIRPFNVYGPFRYGTNAMTALCEAAINNTPITLSGDGEQTRSWCYITDFVDGILRALTIDGIEGKSFNLGNDTNNPSMHELARMICRKAHSASPIVISGTKTEDVANRMPDLALSRGILGYNPIVPVEDGVRAVLKWLEENMQNARNDLLVSV